MQENEFEKKVQNKMTGFSLLPNEEVWKQVEARIGKEKKRRLIFFLIIAGLFLTGGIGTLIFLNHKNTSELSNVLSNKKPANVSVVKKPVLKKKDETLVQEKDMLKGNTKVSTKSLQPSLANKKTKVFHYKKMYSSKATPNENPELAKAKQKDLSPQKDLTPPKKENEIQKPDKSIVLKGMKNTPRSEFEDRTELPPHKFLLSQTDQKLIADTMQKSLSAANDRTGIKDTTLFVANDNTIEEKNFKNILGKWKFGFTIYGGVSDNVKGIGIVSAKSFLAADQSGLYSFQSNTSVNSVTSVSQLSYKNGASFGAGAYVQKGLTRRLSAIVGVDYHYMSARSLVGNKVSSELNIFDSVLQKPTIVNSYYRAGQTTSFSNKYHLVKLPANLQLQLNRNINRPLIFSFGLAPSILITTNALYLNNNARAYYREKKQFNYFMLFGQSELLYTLSNRPKYQLNIGPALQYDFNSFSKTATHTPQHLIFTGLKTNITLK